MDYLFYWLEIFVSVPDKNLILLVCKIVLWIDSNQRFKHSTADYLVIYFAYFQVVANFYEKKNVHVFGRVTIFDVENTKDFLNQH